MIDPLQVIESKNLGADCILIIIGMNSIEDNKTIEAMALDIGLECILEVHSLEELEATKYFSSNIIGINNRDLTTFEVNKNLAIELAKNISKEVIVVSESGISSREDILSSKEQGIHTFLIGESFMRETSPGEALREILV